MTIGSKIDKLLAEKGITQRELAKIIGVTETSMSRYVHGSRTPRALVLIDIARTLGVSTDYLLGMNDEDE